MPIAMQAREQPQDDEASVISTVAQPGDSDQHREPFHSMRIRLTRAKLQSKLKLSSLRDQLSKRKDRVAHNQTASPLFALPLEIREQIWEYTLRPDVDSAHPHFHIYDTVFDSCTYEQRIKEDAARRKKPTQMSLLLTCHRAYSEALHHLYKHTTFTLVLLAGRPRPSATIHHHHCLGTLKQCEALFNRMQHVNLIIQAGAQPDMDKLAARIAAFLDATNYLYQAKELRIQLNIHHLFFTWGDERLRAITAALMPLCKKAEPFPGGTSVEGGLEEIPKTSHMLRWSPAEGNSVCLRRGAYGDRSNDDRTPPTTRSGRFLANLWLTTFVVVYLGMWPVTLPITLWAHRKRKLDKGEW